MIDRGHIVATWSHTDLEDLQFRDHYPCYRQTIETQKYYNDHNSKIWQILEESPGWIHNLADALPNDFVHHVVSATKIDPGSTVPYHVDYHTVLRQTHGEGDTWRYLIFLEPWRSGHYFEILGEPVTKWRAGDWIKFHRTDWHLAGNMGVQPFYSAQITVK